MRRPRSAPQAPRGQARHAGDRVRRHRLDARAGKRIQRRGLQRVDEERGAVAAAGEQSQYRAALPLQEGEPRRVRGQVFGDAERLGARVAAWPGESSTTTSGASRRQAIGDRLRQWRPRRRDRMPAAPAAAARGCRCRAFATASRSHRPAPRRPASAAPTVTAPPQRATAPPRPSRAASFASHVVQRRPIEARGVPRRRANRACAPSPTSSSISAPMPAATRADAPNNAVTASGSPASSSALPCAVSITPGPERPKRACGHEAQVFAGRRQHRRAAERGTGDDRERRNAGAPHVEQRAQRPRQRPVPPRWLRAGARRRNRRAARRHPDVRRARAGTVGAARRRDSRRCCRPGTARPAPRPARAPRRSRGARTRCRRRLPAQCPSGPRADSRRRQETARGSRRRRAPPVVPTVQVSRSATRVSEGGRNLTATLWNNRPDQNNIAARASPDTVTHEVNAT